MLVIEIQLVNQMAFAMVYDSILPITTEVGSELVSQI